MKNCAARLFHYCFDLPLKISEWDEPESPKSKPIIPTIYPPPLQLQVRFHLNELTSSSPFIRHRIDSRGKLVTFPRYFKLNALITYYRITPSEFRLPSPQFVTFARSHVHTLVKLSPFEKSANVTPYLISYAVGSESDRPFVRCLVYPDAASIETMQNLGRRVSERIVASRGDNGPPGPGCVEEGG